MKKVIALLLIMCLASLASVATKNIAPLSQAGQRYTLKLMFTK